MPIRRTFPLLLLALLILPASAAHTPLPRTLQTDSIVGRWDLTVRGPAGDYPSWLEIRRSGRSALVGEFVGRVGSARPIAHVQYTDGVLRFAIPPQWEEGEADLRVEGRFAEGRLTGELTTPSGQRHPWSAVRAPSLRRTAPPTWGEPISLFIGNDLTGWRIDPAGAPNRWEAVDGVLRNTGPGGNLVTTAAFDDFRLHLQFRYPVNGNSGVYLRGRHEVQIEDSGEIEPSLLSIGGIYGFLRANQPPGTRPGEWNLYEITLIGRRVTVAINGRTLIADRPIPGITGGALDSNEGGPGPLMLQGDHTAVEFRDIVLTPAVAR